MVPIVELEPFMRSKILAVAVRPTFPTFTRLIRVQRKHLVVDLK